MIKDIVDIYNKYKGIYGYRRIYIYLRLKLHQKVNHKRVYRLMNQLNLKSTIRPKRKRYIKTTPEITAIRDADRVAGLLEANNIYNVKLLVNRVRPDMIQKNDMMSVRDVQEMLGIPLLGAIPEDNHVIISTNRGEPLVLKRKLTLSGIAFENAARRLIGKQDYFIDLSTPYKGIFQKVQDMIFGT